MVAVEDHPDDGPDAAAALYVELASSAVESLQNQDEPESEDHGRAMIVGLAVGAAIGLLLDALLSRMVASVW